MISFPFQLRFLFANYPAVMSKVFSIVTRLIPTYLIQKGGAKHITARTGAELPALSEKRLVIIGNGNVRSQLKTPYRDGTTGNYRKLSNYRGQNKVKLTLTPTKFPANRQRM